MSARTIAGGFAESASICQQRSVPEFKTLSKPSKEDAVYPSFVKDGEFSRNPGVLMANFALVLGMTLISQI